MDELRAKLRRCLALAGIVTVVACSDGQPRISPAAESAPAMGGKVDSILPADEALGRFLANEPRSESLHGGAGSRNEIVGQLFSALASRDTAALAKLLVTRAEYGHLYYPSSIYARKPYELAPDIAWMLNAESNAKAMRRLLGRLGGIPLELEEVSCRKESPAGGNHLASECDVTYRIRGEKSETRRLFNALMERDGRVKFLSYSGDF